MLAEEVEPYVVHAKRVFMHYVFKALVTRFLVLYTCILYFLDESLSFVYLHSFYYSWIRHYVFLTMGLHLNRFFCNGLLYWIQTKPIFAVISIYFLICKPVLYPNNKPFTCFCKILLGGLITNFLQTVIILLILTLLIWFFLQIKAH